MLKRGATIEHERSIMDDERNPVFKSITVINVVDEIDLNNLNKISFQIYPDGFPTLPKDMHLRMPSGQRNRQEWFNKYFDKVVVK